MAVATTAEGGRVPVQQIPSGEVTYSATASVLQAEVPAFGFRRYWLHVIDPDPEADATADGPPPAQAGADGALTNGLITVTVDHRTGVLTGLDGLIAPDGVRPVVLDDGSDTWSHGVARYDGEAEEGELLAVSVVEPGPVRATYRSVWSFGGGRSTVVQDVSLYQDRPFVEVRLDVEWHESRRLLKLHVPTTLQTPSSAAGAPYGFVERACTGHEEPMVHWVDLFDGGDDRGLACTADTAGGYDALGPTLRLTVLRSPKVADHGWGWGNDDPSGYPVTDQGRHRLRYRLAPHRGSAGDAQVVRLAEEHRIALPTVLDTWHRGPLGPEATAMVVQSTGAVVPVVKRAEDGDGTVLRIWEITGRAGQVELSLGSPGRTWRGELAPHQVSTLHFPDDERQPVRVIDTPELARD
jgi:alpha-mannosidase